MDKEIEAVLLPEEKVLLEARQRGNILLGGDPFGPSSIYITDMRIFVKNQHPFRLGAIITDMNYKDVGNVRLFRGIFSTAICIRSRFMTTDLVIDGVDKKLAEKAIVLIQDGIRRYDKK